MFQFILMICSVFYSLDNTKVLDKKNDELALNTIQINLEKKFTSQEKKDFFVIYGFLEDCKYLKNKNEIINLKAKTMLSQWSKKDQIALYSIKAEKKLTPGNITKEIKEKLIFEAQRARTYAYAPYSKFFVGCAILTKDGKIYSGCNLENAAYGSTICAERVALAKAVSSENSGFSFQKNREIVAVAVVLKNSGCPCGSCRQSLYEFNPDMLVIMADIDGKVISEKSLNDLLPLGFGPYNLN